MRSMSTDMLAAIQAGQIYPAIFIQAQFATGTIYIWSGYGSVTWGGHTWQGVGSLLSVSGIEEGATIEARGISIGLSGIDPALLADALQEFKVGAPAVIYLGMFSGSPLALLSAPISCWAGQMDQATIDVSAETATITVNCESLLILHNVAVDYRYTNDCQYQEYPGDIGLQFKASICNQNLYWGRTPNAS